MQLNMSVIWPILSGIAGFILGALIIRFFLKKSYAKEIERALDKQAKLVSSAGFMLRTPLNNLLGFVGTLTSRSESFSHENKVLIKKLLGSGSELKRTLVDILDIFELENGELQIMPQERDLSKTLANSKKFGVQWAQKKGLYLRFDCDDNVNGNYMFDEVRFRQCLDNLVYQAISQTLSGGVTVTVNVEPPHHHSTQAKLTATVKDTSPGMDQYMTDAYFDPSKKLHSTFSAHSDASRMTLTLTKRLVELMGGKLTAHSAFGSGVTFSFDLPLTFVSSLPQDTKSKSEASTSSLSVDDILSTATIKPTVSDADKDITSMAEPVAVTPPPTKVTPKIDIKDASVLVVDDNKINREVMGAFLKQLGVKDFTNAENGQIAVEKTQSTAFDVILMDLQMPVMTGIEATGEIRTSDLDWKNVPIIACTAAVSSAVKRECNEVGMNDFLPKPINLEDLRNALDAHFICT